VSGTSTQTSYLVTGLTPGTTYDFTVEARNAYGYSSPSSTLTLLAAYIPEIPTDVVTAIEGSTVRVSWNLASDNGSPITNYKVYIQEHGSTTFTQESVECDGSL
jgi:hypothetical protein